MITEMTMGKQEHRVSVDNGKYTFVSEGFGVIDILRGGHPWHSQSQAANALHTMMCELDAARVVVQAARETVEAVRARRANGEDFDPQYFPLAIADALALHDSLTSDREPPSAWCGAETEGYAQVDESQATQTSPAPVVMNRPTIPVGVRQAMLNLAHGIRETSRRTGSGFYDDEFAQAKKAAVRDAIDEIANCIDEAFDFNSTYQSEVE